MWSKHITLKEDDTSIHVVGCATKIKGSAQVCCHTMLSLMSYYVLCAGMVSYNVKLDVLLCPLRRYGVIQC